MTDWAISVSYEHIETYEERKRELQTITKRDEEQFIEQNISIIILNQVNEDISGESFVAF